MAAAINIPLTDKWKAEINRERLERDLAVIVQNPSLLIQAETKSGKSGDGDASTQVEKGKRYFEDIHGSYLSNFTFVPAISMPDPVNQVNLKPHQADNCLEYYLRDANFQGNSAEVQWWSSLKSKTEPHGSASQDEYEDIVKRLILHSSLTLTTLPQQLSRQTHLCHLIVLR